MINYLTPKKLAELNEFASKHLSSGRYYHSQCVQRQAEKIAVRTGADIRKAAVAGLLHDICKEMPKDEQLQYMCAHDILLSNEILQNPGIWHGFVASFWIKENLNIYDDEISSAIYYHSTGKPNMSPLEKTIFLADLTSIDRDFKDAKDLRNTLDTGINPTLAYCLNFKLEHSRKNGKQPLDDSLMAYKYYSEVNKNLKQEDST